MIQRFFAIDTIRRRAPLGLRFLDLARGVSVNDSLIVTARQIGTEGPRWQAARSPLSGIYSFLTLPRLRAFEIGEQSASAWCGDTTASDMGEPTAQELTNAQTLHALVSANEAPTANANFVISVEDQMGRFLPQTLLMCLPREHLVEVPLFSSPARLAPAGTGTLCGQVMVQDAPPVQPARWALVIVTVDGHTYVGMTDARGMFAIFVPYASALPPLSSSQPGTGHTVDQLAWQVTIEVLYQPVKQLLIATGEAPDTLSIIQQGSAHIYDVAGAAPVSTITRAIRFGGDLKVKTLLPADSPQAVPSQLLVDAVS